MEIGATLNHRYKLTAELGKGAMGVVYRATDTQTGQEVAVKAIARELAVDPEMLERFRREGEALRQLRHPNIVGFVDMFAHEGQQVIVMEFVAGGNLRDLLRREGQLPLERARQITLDLCDALIRAHRLNIIHRDLKPENVLIAEDGTPRLTDFGVARLANKSTFLTATGVQVGTPLYMSPEAWEGKPLDAQTDIWSLGVMLYEMVGGSVPFSGDTVVTVMNKVLTQTPADLKTLRRDVPDGLARIIRRMLTRDKAQRYATARQVSADLEECSFEGAATIPDRRLSATKTSAVSKRYGWLVVAGVAALVVCVVAAALGLWLLGPRLWGGPSTPVAQAPDATITQPLAGPTSKPAITSPRPTSPAETLAPSPTQDSAAATASTPVPPAAGKPAAAPITAANAASLSQVSFGKIQSSPVDMAMAPDGKTLLVASYFRAAAYNLGNLEKPLYELQDTQSANRLALTADGKVLATGGSNGVITLWDLSRNGVKLADLKGHTEAITGLAFSPDGTRLASAGGRDKSMRLWDVASGKELFTSTDANAEVGSVAFSPDGATLAAGSADKKIRVWDVKTITLNLELDAQSGDSGNVDALAFSPDGQLLASAGQYDPAIHVWDARAWEPAIILHPSNPKDSHTGFYSLAFDPASKLLAAGGADNSIRLWDMGAASPTRYQELAVLLRHSDWVNSVLFTPDGGTLISASARDGTVRLWQAGASTSSAAASVGPTAQPPATVAAPILASNAALLGEALTVKMSSPVDVALSPDGQTLVVATNFNMLVFGFTNLTKAQYELKGQQTLSRVAISPDGRLLASAGSSFDGTIWLWDLARGGVKGAVLKGHTEAIAGIAFSPDGSLLASAGGRDKSWHLWDVKNAKDLFVDTQPQGEVDSVAFSPDGVTLAVGYSDKKIRLWDVKSTKLKQELDAESGDVGYVNSLIYSPNGKYLVSAGEYDSAIHVWDTQTWKAAVVLHGSNWAESSYGFYSLAFNQSGALLAAGGHDGSVRVWDLDPASPTFGKELVVLQRHADWVDSVLFTPDGGTLISASDRDGTIRLWQLGAGK